jgi:hypothetical protein
MTFVKLILIERLQNMPMPSSGMRGILIVVRRTACPLKMFARAIVMYTARWD